MNSRKEGFYIWRCLPNKESVKVGIFALEQFENGKIDNIQFKYTDEYLQCKDAIPLDPANTPLTNALQVYETNGRYLPGFIDDCLPDDWGKKILALILKIKYIDVLTLLNNHNSTSIGDIIITSSSFKAKPVWGNGIKKDDINRVIENGWNGHLDLTFDNFQYISMLKTGGSGVGGARPKLLVSDEDGEWLYKFNRSNDLFDMAVAEWTCIEVARKAGLNTPECFIDSVSERKCLKVKRFDISPDGGRFHLLTLNSLLKNQYSQEDPFSSSYEDIGKMIKKYCIDPVKDMKQLLGQLLLNGQLRNTDDHLRNFSLINKGEGWELSPAYDIVPSQENDCFHQLSFLNKAYMPSLKEAEEAGKALGISKTDSLRIAKKIEIAVAKFYFFLNKCDISGDECEKIMKSVRQPQP